MNRINVHTVGSGTDHASESACTEFKFTVETVFNLLLIPFDSLKLGLGIIIKPGIFKPFAVFILITHL